MLWKKGSVPHNHVASAKGRKGDELQGWPVVHEPLWLIEK